jgi:KDEL-tailed cysteine endopeptidase
LKAAVAIGPVGVSVDADTNFRNYAGGILTDCGASLNHGIVVVGYGADASGNEYWIVRNSWGPSWGLGGYIQIGISSTANNGTGVCGIQTRPSWPTTKSSKN